MIKENIKVRIYHSIAFDREEITEELKDINHLFEEIVIRPLSCILRNEEKGYRVLINRKFIDFEFNNDEHKYIISMILKHLNLFGVAEDVKVTYLFKSNNSIKGFNNLYKDIPEEINTEFIGFRVIVDKTNYLNSLFLNMESTLTCRIAFTLNDIKFEQIENELTDQSIVVAEKVIPLIYQVIGGVI